MFSGTTETKNRYRARNVPAKPTASAGSGRQRSEDQHTDWHEQKRGSSTPVKRFTGEERERRARFKQRWRLEPIEAYSLVEQPANARRRPAWWAASQLGAWTAAQQAVFLKGDELRKLA